jgi:nucleotide-binding universal stress UspA family protein
MRGGHSRVVVAWVLPGVLLIDVNDACRRSWQALLRATGVRVANFLARKGESQMTSDAERTTGTETRANVVRMRTDPAVRKRVLCATDLSACSKPAVTRGTLLANQLNAQLTLLHVIDVAQGLDHSGSPRDELGQQLSSTGLHVRGDLRIVLRAGSHVETIAAVARETGADIIVLGAQRRKCRAPLIGMTAERVISLAGRPVLIVNVSPRIRYASVVIAAELSDAFTRVVRIASSLKFLDAEKVSIVHGFEAPCRGCLYAEGFDVRAAKRNLEAWERALRARLLSSFDAAGVESSRFRVIFQQARWTRALQRIVRSVQPDLLIVGTKDRSMFNRIVRGSVANDALRDRECDVLVAARQNEADVLH